MLYGGPWATKFGVVFRTCWSLLKYEKFVCIGRREPRPSVVWGADRVCELQSERAGHRSGWSGHNAQNYRGRVWGAWEGMDNTELRPHRHEDWVWCRCKRWVKTIAERSKCARVSEPFCARGWFLKFWRFYGPLSRKFVRKFAFFSEGSVLPAVWHLYESCSHGRPELLTWTTG